MPGNPDDVDELLVRALQQDGRASFETLARLVGLARSTTKARVQRLIEEGGLRLIGAIHPAVFGLHQLGHVIVETEGAARPVAERIAALGETSFVTTTAGRFAVTAELRAADLESFAAGLARVQAVPGVRAVQTITYLRVWKDPYFPPGPLESPGPLADLELDDVDHLLLAQLRDDGRASFAELAKATGLSPGAARARVLRLLESGVVHIGALVRLSRSTRTHTIGFAVHATGDTEPVARRIAEFGNIDCFATGVGWCNGIGSIQAQSPDEVLDTLERLRELPGVRAIESWSHLRAVKEENDRPLTAVGTGQG